MKLNILPKTFYVLFLWLILLFALPNNSHAFVRGIYVTQTTLESTPTIKYLIANAKEVGIGTFVIDYDRMSKRTQQNIALVKEAGIRFVARIVMFPYGALPSQVSSEAYLARRFRQIQEAVSLGADTIQLDYIRYRSSQHGSSQNAIDIYGIIDKIRKQLETKGVSLEVDVFGEATLFEAKYIGQNVQLFAQAVDAICPMVYPSHYFPYAFHARRPYETVYNSLSSLRRQISGYPDVHVYAYIELFNFRFPLSRNAKIQYILDEFRAVRDAHADGWYAWSATNKYRLLFYILAQRKNADGIVSIPAKDSNVKDSDVEEKDFTKEKEADNSATTKDKPSIKK